MKTMKLIMIMCVAAVSVFAEGKKKDIKPQSVCPVMGGKINKDVFTDHDGYRVYFCCPGCDKQFLKDPQKYIDAIEARGETVALVQTKCPVMGGKIDKKAYYDHDGKRIYMCCLGCAKILGKDPAKYIKKLEDGGVALDLVPVNKTRK